MKIGNLLKKELKELLSLQAIFSMLFTCLLLIVIGQVMGNAMEEAVSNTVVTVINHDDSEFTQKMLEALPDKYGVTPELTNGDGLLRDMGQENVVIIPEGFGESIVNGSEPANIQIISLVNKSGMTATISGASVYNLTSAVEDYVKKYTESQKLMLSEEQSSLLREPVIITEYTEANGKTVKASAEELLGVLMGQFMIGPMAVFFLVMMASQMIMTAISTEKIDKTLETLLSAPVSRLSVLAAKMIAALIVALLNAGSMIVGFVFYINGMTGNLGAAAAGAGTEENVINIAAAMGELGLTLSGGDILLFGLQLFLTIAIGLSLSLILGAMATDVKSVQTLSIPIMMMTMIPFFASMFADINTMPAGGRLVMYIIPFTHTYTAMGNIMFGNMAYFWGGFVYQLIFFIVCMYLAVRVFTTDLLFTVTFTPGAKKGGRKKGRRKEEA